MKAFTVEPLNATTALEIGRLCAPRVRKVTPTTGEGAGSDGMVFRAMKLNPLSPEGYLKRMVPGLAGSAR
jgi:hypothetical protein